jgi:hypothetical protein
VPLGRLGINTVAPPGSGCCAVPWRRHGCCPVLQSQKGCHPATTAVAYWKGEGVKQALRKRSQYLETWWAGASWAAFYFVAEMLKWRVLKHVHGDAQQGFTSKVLPCQPCTSISSLEASAGCNWRQALVVPQLRQHSHTERYLVHHCVQDCPAAVCEFTVNTAAVSHVSVPTGAPWRSPPLRPAWSPDRLWEWATVPVTPPVVDCCTRSIFDTGSAQERQQTRAPCCRCRTSHAGHAMQPGYGQGGLPRFPFSMPLESLPHLPFLALWLTSAINSVERRSVALLARYSQSWSNCHPRLAIPPRDGVTGPQFWRRWRPPAGDSSE